MSQHELDDLVEKVIGAAIEVHRFFGPGFQEVTYQKALAVELNLRNIVFQREVPVQLRYKDEVIGEGQMDFLIAEKLVVELKAVEARPEKFRRQVVAYLKATELSLGLVINFRADLLKHGIARVSNSA